MLDFHTIEKHPNPQFYRGDFILLDGEWEFAFDAEENGLQECWQCIHTLPLKIRVPFVYQSRKSGIGKSELCRVVWYKRRFKLPDGFSGKRTVLHFLAVDYACDVWINGLHAARHIGGYSGFEADITELLCSGENDITVRVCDDDFAKQTMRGKQLWGDGDFGCWYKRYTGIWQSVWLEAVNEIHISRFILRPDLDTNCVRLKAELAGLSAGETVTAELAVRVGETDVAKATFEVHGGYLNECLSVDYAGSPFRGSEWWSPEHPTLYQMSMVLRRGRRTLDSVQTYFGMKKLEASHGRVLLNNFPFYHRSILNQGYYPEGYITPEDDERIISDIRLIKSLGYNAMRIHQKIESPRFLYWCDRLGITVWEEMPSMYAYRELEAHQILKEMTAIVARDINHPCINAWVMFNESWGIQQVRFDGQQQHLASGAYHIVKSMDPTRFVIGNDGWQQTETDLMTIHDYSACGSELTARYSGWDCAPGSFPPAGQRRFAFAEGYTYGGQPVMMTEFGGISYAADGGWGYNDKVKTEEEFLARFEGLTAALKAIDYLAGYCYTQFTDVENEQNGLVTIERRPKADPEKIRAINLA